MKCLVCGAELDVEYHLLERRLSRLGYYHADTVLKCEACGWMPVLGVELEATEPPYFFPLGMPEKRKHDLWIAVRHAWPTDWHRCLVCGKGQFQIHKIFWGISHYEKKEHPRSEEDRKRYILIEEGLMYAWIAGHITVQLKCNHCYYVRYFTI